MRFRKEEQLLKAEEEAKRRMEGADARRKEHRRGIVRKANDANSKVKRAVLSTFSVCVVMYSLQCLVFVCVGSLFLDRTVISIRNLRPCVGRTNKRQLLRRAAVSPFGRS